MAAASLSLPLECHQVICGSCHHLLRSARLRANEADFLVRLINKDKRMTISDHFLAHGSIPQLASCRRRYRKLQSFRVKCEALPNVEFDSAEAATSERLHTLQNSKTNGVMHPKIDFDWESEQKIGGRSVSSNGLAVESGTRPFSAIVEFLRGKNVLITGSTGFLAKVLVEKVLREQPDVGQLFLVIQPRSDMTAQQRLEGQVIGSQIFDQLRGVHSNQYTEFMTSKLTALPWNMSEDFLRNDQGVAAEVREKVDIIIHSAATTAFDERYDVALNINTLGSQRLLQFAKTCKNLQLLLQVSTAYTNGTRKGRTLEKPFVMGESLVRELPGGKNAPKVDVENEINLAKSALRKAEAEAEAKSMSKGAAASYIQKQMVELGMHRATMHGWQDVYVFTKALAEMILSEAKDELPIAIIRPSIVESALAEPLLAWMEGIRMADPILLAYGKGQVGGFLADQRGLIDVVPVDIVINAILAAAVKHAQKPGITVYHVATSVANPLTLQKLVDATSDHFEAYPMLARDGTPVVRMGRMKLFQTKEGFQSHMWIKYHLPILFQRIAPWIRNTDMTEKRNSIMLKTYDQLTYLAKIYVPYTFYDCRFDATNTQNLFAELSAEDKQRFNFDLKRIDWQSYIVLHLAGLRKYVLKGRGTKKLPI